VETYPRVPNIVSGSLLSLQARVRSNNSVINEHESSGKVSCNMQQRTNQRQATQRAVAELHCYELQG
jgi:hypothetical protein